MSSQTTLVSTGLSPQQAQAIVGKTTNGLVATGSTQADALPLPSVIDTFVTVAAGTGAILPQGAGGGDTIIIFNNGANDLSVYPPGGGSINGGATNSPYTHVAGKVGIYWCVAKFVWVCLSGGADGGGAITGVGLAGQAGVWSGVSNLIANGVGAPIISLLVKNIGFAAEFDNGNSGAAKSITWANGNFQKLTLTAACTITLGTPTYVGRYQLRIVQDGNNAWLVTWAGAAYSASRWVGDPAAPAVNIANLGETIVSFYFDGTNLTQYLGIVGA